MQRLSELSSTAQQQLYAKFVELRKDGLGYKRILTIFNTQDQVHLAKSTLGYWANHHMTMIGGENYFDPIPSPSLSYVAGVLFGDATIPLVSKKQDYHLRLDATDKDFVDTFAGTTAQLLRKPKPFFVCWTKKQTYSTQARSKRLYQFARAIKNDFEKAKPFIETYPADFIRGLADSEGSAIVIPKNNLRLVIVVAYSTNLELLQYVQELLQRKWMIQTYLRIEKTAGMQDSIIDGRIITRTKDLYSVKITSKSNAKKYVENVCFTLLRKKLKCEDYFALVEKYGPHQAANEWLKYYHKEGRQWRRNTLVN